MRITYLIPVLLGLLLSTPTLAQEGSAQALVGACARCHGEDGNSPGQYPSLARQQQAYLVKQMMDFKSGARSDPQMSPMIGILNEENVQLLAKFYAGENLNRQRGIKEDLAKAGKQIAADLDCASCHQKNYRGKDTVPRISRQKRVYLVKQMEDFRDGKRTNDDGIKAESFKNLTDDQITKLSHYFAGM